MQFFRYFACELLKLRRSLALLLCVTAPMLVAAIGVLISVRSERMPDLATTSMSSAAVWAFAMLPLTVAALSVLLAQTEHGPKTWDHLLALPGARPNLFLAKAAVMIVCITGMALLLTLLIIGGGAVISALRTSTGAIDPAALLLLLARMTAAAMLLAMLQLWTALRFRSFVPPLALGIGGTFVAIAATGAKEGAYFPWLMPVNMLAANQSDQQLPLLLGSVGGLVMLAAMVIDLSFREA